MTIGGFMYQEIRLTMVATNTTSIMFKVTRLLDFMMDKKAGSEGACDRCLIDDASFKHRMKRSH